MAKLSPQQITEAISLLPTIPSEAMSAFLAKQGGKSGGVVNPGIPAYLVDSCGTTLDISNNKSRAVACYFSATGPQVTLLERRPSGALIVLAQKRRSA
jgi:hypothetical protein